MLAYNRAAVKKENLAILDSSVQSSVINGDRVGMEETLFRFLASGDISKADYENRKLAASQDMDIEAYSQQITRAEDTGDLDDIWDNVGLGMSPTKLDGSPSDTTSEQRRSMRAHINSQRSRLEAQEHEDIMATEREGGALLAEGRMGANWVRDHLRDGSIERPAAMALLSAARDTTSATSSVVRSGAISAYQDSYIQALMSPQFGEQVSDIARTIKKELNANTHLNGAEKAKLYDYVVKFENSIDNNPQFVQAKKYISSSTNVPENIDAYTGMQQAALGITKLQKAAHNDFLTGLVLYMDEFGSEADPMEWVARNEGRYNRVGDEPDKAVTLNARLTREFPELTVPDGKLTEQNRDSIMFDAATKYYQPGNRASQEKMFDIWSMLYDTALDLSGWGDLP